MEAGGLGGMELGVPSDKYCMRTTEKKRRKKKTIIRKVKDEKSVMKKQV